jgi:MFS superfamily sulfate permease-like transporter
VLEVAAGVVLVGLAAGVPLALILAAAALAARATRRRRREATLRV